MNKFTKEEEKQIIRCIDKAEELYFKYVNACEKVEEILNAKNPQEKDFVKEVLYQMSDGICVCYEAPDFNIAANIPILRYIDGERQ